MNLRQEKVERVPKGKKVRSQKKVQLISSFKKTNHSNQVKITRFNFDRRIPEKPEQVKFVQAKTKKAPKVTKVPRIAPVQYVKSSNDILEQLERYLEQQR
jgi:hypothetical protein